MNGAHAGPRKPRLATSFRRLAVGGLVALALGCSRDSRSAASDVVTDFYAAVRRSGTTGAPSATQQALLAPYLSAELQSLLLKARAVRDAESARTPDEKPPFAEGDLFTSLFEGHSALEILADSQLTDANRLTVRFTHDGSPPPTTWTDHVLVRMEAGRPVVADVEYGGDWPFANRGTLVTSLVEALRANGVDTSGIARTPRPHE